MRLSVSQSTLYWDWLDGSPLLSGTLSLSKASLKDTGTVNADSTDAGLGPCTLDSQSDLELTLGSGAPAASFSGTMAYAYAPVSGATCTDVLASSGGMYDALPCSLVYDVTATRQ